MMGTDLRRRAEWLRNVSARIPARDVAQVLVGYAIEMERQAEQAETRALAELRLLN